MADAVSNVKDYADDLWWLFVFQGVATIIFGIIALFFPGLTLVGLVYIFAIFVVVWGVTELIRGLVQIGRVGSWWLSILFGIAAAGVGVYLISNPNTLAQVFVIIVGALILGRALVDLYLAVFVVRSNENRILWALTGVLGVIAGILLWKYPLTSSLAFVWVLGLYAVIVGSMTIAFALRVRSEVEQGIDEVKKAVGIKKR